MLAISLELKEILVQFECVRVSFITSTIRKILVLVLLTTQVHVVGSVALIESVFCVLHEG
jgi:hypothetical protein